MWGVRPTHPTKEELITIVMQATGADNLTDNGEGKVASAAAVDS